jgi:phosphate transport system substrate-binding protein
MKKITRIICFFASLIIVNQSVAQVKVKGSDTMLPLVQELSEIYTNKQGGAPVAVTGGGSGTGINALKGGSTDIAMSSRAMKMGEKITFEQSKKSVKEMVIGFDALSIIVNPNNKISMLTREQLEGIFTGKITNWKEVGGEDMKIIPYTRESSSGTYEFMKEYVLDGKEFTNTAISTPATAGIVQSVSQTKGAIGYIGLAYLEAIVKPVSVSFNGGNFVAPTFKNAIDKKYPIIRELYFFYLKSEESKFKPFLNFVLSDIGQKALAHKGYIPAVVKSK